MDLLVVGDTAVAELHGEVDASVAPRLRERVGAAIAGGASTVVVDAAAVTFFDGAAVGAVASLAREVGRRGGRLVVVAPSRAVRRVMALTGLDRAVPVLA